MEEAKLSVTPRCPELYEPPVSETHTRALPALRLATSREARRSRSTIDASSFLGSSSLALTLETPSLLPSGYM